MQLPLSLWVGLAVRREFSDIVLSLRDHYRVQTIDRLAQIDRDKPPQLVILAQSRPDEFSAVAVGELREAWPQTRFISVLGNWCEGRRNGVWWTSDVPRIWARDWRSRIGPDELRSVGTALQGTQKAAARRPQFVPPTNAMLIAIYASRASYRQALADGLADAGHKVVASRIELPVQIRGVDFVVWEVPRVHGLRQKEISTLRTRHASAELIGLLAFPRDDEVRRLHKAGVRHMVSQPFPLEDLGKTLACSVSDTRGSVA